MLGVLLLSTCSAAFTTLGTYRLDEAVVIRQLCDDCTTVNISSLTFPNGTAAWGYTAMARSGTEYTVTFNKSNVTGIYHVNGVGDEGGVPTIWAYTFEITGSGDEFTTGMAVFYIGIMLVLIFLFVVCLVGASRLPTEDPIGNDGKIMDVNYLKHLRPVLFICAWGILLIISFLAMAVAETYLQTNMVVRVFLTIHTIMMWATMVGVPVYSWWIFVKFIQDRRFKRYIERGLM